MKVVVIIILTKPSDLVKLIIEIFRRNPRKDCLKCEHFCNLSNFRPQKHRTLKRMVTWKGYDCKDRYLDIFPSKPMYTVDYLEVCSLAFICFGA